MTISATKSTTDWVRAYLTIWQGMLSLSARELDVLCLICLRYILLQENVLDVTLQNEMLLSTTARTQMRTELGMSTNHFQNTLTSLGEKRALLRDEAGLYYISAKLLPQTTLTFNFKVND